jgi:arabinan endo-1,5-alpha-L-arabinosidase
MCTEGGLLLSLYGRIRIAACILYLAALIVASGCSSPKPVQAAFAAAPSLLSDYKLTGSVDPVRDPSLIRQGSTYYLFSTDDGVPVGGSIKIRCSEDLVSWRDCGHVFDAVPAWVIQVLPRAAGIWAPDISYFNGEYHLYYVGSIFGTNQSVIGLVTNVTLDPSDSNYAWIDRGEILSSARGDDFNALDPNITIESDGSVWLTYGSFWTGIKQAEVNPLTGMLASGNPEAYSLAARPQSSPSAVEAPFIVHHGSYYYLFVSFGLCCAENPYQSDYRIMVGRGSSVHGPFADMNGVPMLQGGGTEILAGSGSNWNAPGGQSLFVDPATGATTIAFHAHRLPAGTPYVFVNTVTWNNDWPQIAPE